MGADYWHQQCHVFKCKREAAFLGVVPPCLYQFSSHYKAAQPDSNSNLVLQALLSRNHRTVFCAQLLSNPVSPPAARDKGLADRGQKVGAGSAPLRIPSLGSLHMLLNPAGEIR